MATIEKIVLDVTNGLSGKFVPCPTKSMVLRELVVSLNRFRESLRWAVFFHENPVHQSRGKCDFGGLMQARLHFHAPMCITIRPAAF